MINHISVLINKLTKEMPETSLGIRLARSTFWSLAGAFISRGMALLASIFVARKLGKSVFGELGIIQSTVSMFQAFAGVSLGLAATKYVAEYKHSNRCKAGRIIGLSEYIALATGAAFGLLLLISSNWLAVHMLSAPQLASMIRLAAPMIVLGSINGAKTGILSGLESFRSIAQINLIVGIFSFPLMVGGAYWKGLTGALWGMIASMALNLLLNQLKVKERLERASISPDYKNCLEEKRIFSSFALPAILASIMVSPIMWICNSMLVRQAGGYAEMGIFNAANQWRQILLFLPGILMQATLPIMSESNGLLYNRRSWAQIKLSLKIIIYISTPLLLILWLFSRNIMSSYGPSFSSSGLVFIFAQLAAYLQVIQAPIVTYWAASGKMWRNFLANVGWGVLLIVLCRLLIGEGAQGVMLSLLISFFAFGIYLCIFSCKEFIWKAR